MLLLFLLELLEPPIGMTPDLVRSRLWKRFGLVAGASRDRQEDEQTYGHSDPTLLHTAPSIIHSYPLMSILLIKCALQVIDCLHDASV
jgi:hypothetical protein